MRKKVVNKKNAKSREYHDVLTKITKHGKCPFCFQNFNEFSFSKHQPIKRSKDWFVVKNSWPYLNSKFHFLIIPKRHIEDLSELNEADLAQVLRLAKFLTKKFSIKGGGLISRFGYPEISGATVSHLHFHLISPKIKTKTKTKAVLFPIG